jgi:hypothetical protein
VAGSFEHGDDFGFQKKKNARNFLSYEISASLDGLCTKELINYVSRKSEKRRAKNGTERKATVMFLWYTIQLHFLRTIPYSSIKHNHVLLYCNYIFQANITDTFKISYNILQLFSLYGIQYDLQWLSQRKIYIKKLSFRIYIKLYKIVVLMSWPVVLSKLCIKNIKMTNVSRKY